MAYKKLTNAVELRVRVPDGNWATLSVLTSSNGSPSPKSMRSFLRLLRGKDHIPNLNRLLLGKPMKPGYRFV